MVWFNNLPILSSFIFMICCVLIWFLFSSDIIKCTLTLFLICEILPSQGDSIFSGEFTRALCVNFSKPTSLCEVRLEFHDRWKLITIMTKVRYNFLSNGSGQIGRFLCNKATYFSPTSVSRSVSPASMSSMDFKILNSMIYHWFRCFMQ